MQNIATSWLKRIECGPVGTHGMVAESSLYFVRDTPAMEGVITVT